MKDKVETGLLLDYYGGILTEKQRKIIRAYCDMDLSLAEVSDEFQITRQAALDSINRGIAKLKNMEEKLCLIQKIRSLCSFIENKMDEATDKQILSEILQAIKEI